jgi:hypothetical protein
MRIRGANPFFNAKTRRRNDSAKRTTSLPLKAQNFLKRVLERSALFASLRLCVEFSR